MAAITNDTAGVIRPFRIRQPCHLQTENWMLNKEKAHVQLLLWSVLAEGDFGKNSLRSPGIPAQWANRVRRQMCFASQVAHTTEVSDAGFH